MKNTHVPFWAFLAAAAIMLGATGSAVAGPSQSAKIFAEVMRECKHATVSEAMFFVSVPGSLGGPATPAQEEAYIASETHWKTAQKKSSCWTRPRWQRYVRAVLTEQRSMYENAHKSNAR